MIIYVCIYIFTHTYMIIHIYIWLCHVGLYWMMCDSHLKSTVGGSMGLSQSCLWHHENGMSIQQLVSIAIVMSIIDVPFLKDHSSYCYVAVVSQESQRVNPNEDMGKVQKSHHPKDDSQDLTNQSSVLQVFEKKAAKGKRDEKSRNPRPTIQSSFSPVLCQDSCAKL